jgi:hypothetical protein
MQLLDHQGCHQHSQQYMWRYLLQPAAGEALIQG